MKPTIGRVVHYVAHGTPVRPDGSQAFPPACRAAVVSEVDPTDAYRVGLVVLNPTGQFFHALASGGCDYAETAETPDGKPVGGTWHWPERVDG